MRKSEEPKLSYHKPKKAGIVTLGGGGGSPSVRLDQDKSNLKQLIVFDRRERVSKLTSEYYSILSDLVYSNSSVPIKMCSDCETCGLKKCTCLNHFHCEEY